MSPEDIAVSALSKLNKNPESTGGKARGKIYLNSKMAQPQMAQPKFPVKPTVIQIVSKGRGYMNHSYRDFSNVPVTVDYAPTDNIEDMSFAEKVHHMLSQEEHKQTMAWMPHGRAFKVNVPVIFERVVCQKYFGHKRYSSFLRQLNNHGFKHISKGPDRNCYYHECIIKNMPHLTKYMPEPRDARRQIPDPDTEPELYKISAAYPVPKKVGEVGKPICAIPVKRPAASPVQPSLLQARLASDVSWLVRQLPPAKRLATSAPAVPTVADLSLARLGAHNALLVQQQQQQHQRQFLDQQLESALREKVLIAAIEQKRQELGQAIGCQPTSIGEFLRRKTYG